MNLAAPKSCFSKYLSIIKDYSVFSTSVNEIRFIWKRNSTNESEDGMTRSGWKIIKFFRSIPESDQKVTRPCAKCFANLVLLGNMEYFHVHRK